jgi:dihydrolipoamide dehydrogenase
MKEIDLVIPNIGGSSDVNVAEIYVSVGDIIQEGSDVLMLETDKATMDVPALQSGKITNILIKRGDKVNEGDVVLKFTPNDKAEEKSLINKVDKSTLATNNIENFTYEEECDVVVIGAGPGGYTAAFRAADLGKRVILVEKYPTLGGVCLNVGCIPSKALLHVAKVINDATEMSTHGIEFGTIKTDIKKIADYKDSVVKKLTSGLDALAQQRKVKVINGIAHFTSKNTISVKYSENIKNIKFDSAIIAVGSEPFKLSNFPYEDSRIIDSTGALMLKDIPKSMLVVGGGIIGLEMAEVYSTLGTKITVVELGSSLIPSADKDLVKVLENRIKKKYSNIYTDTMCSKVEAKKDGIYVTFDGKDGFNTTEKFDKVLIAAGRRPNGKTISAENAGVIVDEKGYIKVDKQCRTNVSHIYAIGDVASQPMLAHKATHEGKIAAENCADLKSYFDARTIPSIAYTDPEIAWMGVTENDARNKGLEIEVGKFPWAASGRALGNGRSDGFTKIITDKKTHKILGAGIVGVNAGELLAETVLALEMDCNIHDVALSIHAHPTMSESVGLACEMIDGSITDLYVPKKRI